MLLIDKYIITVNLIWLLLFDPFIVIHEKVNNNSIHIDIDGVCLTSKCWPVVMRRINRWSCICSFLVLLMSCLLSNLATTFNYVLLRASYGTTFYPCKLSIKIFPVVCPFFECTDTLLGKTFMDMPYVTLLIVNMQMVLSLGASSS